MVRDMKMMLVHKTGLEEAHHGRKKYVLGFFFLYPIIAKCTSTSFKIPFYLFVFEYGWVGSSEVKW